MYSISRMQNEKQLETEISLSNCFTHQLVINYEIMVMILFYWKIETFITKKIVDFFKNYEKNQILN